MGNPYLLDRSLFEHLLRVVPRLTNHVNNVSLIHLGRTITSVFLLEEAAVAFDASLNEADLNGLAGFAEPIDHETKDVVVQAVDVFEFGEEVLQAFSFGV